MWAFLLCAAISGCLSTSWSSAADWVSDTLLGFLEAFQEGGVDRIRLTLHGWRIQLHDLDLRVPELLTEHRDKGVHCCFTGAVVGAAWHWDYAERRGGTLTQRCQRQGLSGVLAQCLAIYTDWEPGRPSFDNSKRRRLFSNQSQRQAGSVCMGWTHRSHLCSPIRRARCRKTYYMIADSLSLPCRKGKNAFVRATPLR